MFFEIHNNLSQAVISYHQVFILLTLRREKVLIEFVSSQVLLFVIWFFFRFISHFHSSLTSHIFRFNQEHYTFLNVFLLFKKVGKSCDQK